MATDTPLLLLLTSTRIHCRTHRCTHSNERPLVSPGPDRRRETRNDSQRNCHCSDTRLELRMFLSTCISLSRPCCRPTILSVLNPSLHCHSVSAPEHNIGSGTSAHSVDTLICAPRDRTTLAPPPCCYCVFFLGMRRGLRTIRHRHQAMQKLPHLKAPVTLQQLRQRWRLSPRPTPRLDAANDREQAVDSIRVQRHSQASAVANCMKEGTSRALANANCLTNSTASLLQRPPVSMATTTSRHLPDVVNSG